MNHARRVFHWNRCAMNLIISNGMCYSLVFFSVFGFVSSFRFIKMSSALGQVNFLDHSTFIFAETMFLCAWAFGILLRNNPFDIVRRMTNVLIDLIHKLWIELHLSINSHLVGIHRLILIIHLSISQILVNGPFKSNQNKYYVLYCELTRCWKSIISIS